MWWLALLPLVMPHTTLEFRWRGAAVTAVWVASVGLWLLSAALLELGGVNTFAWVWLAGLVHFGANIALLVEMIRHHRGAERRSEGADDGGAKGAAQGDGSSRRKRRGRSPKRAR